jgi:hypothetical protein
MEVVKIGTDQSKHSNMHVFMDITYYKGNYDT